MRELADQVERVAVHDPVIHTGVGNELVEDRGDHVEAHDDADRGAGRRIHTGIDHRQVECEEHRCDLRRDQDAAEEHAEDDRADRRALDPAIRDDELLRREQFSQDAVLRRRIRGGAQSHDGVGNERVHRKHHHEAAEHLDRVGDQHDLALRHRVGKRADERGQDHVEHDKRLLQRGLHPVGLVHFLQEPDRRDQQRVVRERAEKLRRHDRVEARLHQTSTVVVYIEARKGQTTGIGYNRHGFAAARALYHDCGVGRSRAWPAAA